MQRLKAQYEQEVSEASQGMDMELMDTQVQHHTHTPFMFQSSH